MAYLIGEHVALASGSYGQVVRILGPGVYRVRIGGTERTRDVDEDFIKPIIPNRRVAPRVFPPVRLTEGAINEPAFAYPFTNEKGFKADCPFWQKLRENGIPEGAVVGVSGSILDVATGDIGQCRQIVLLDINTRTVDHVDRFRRIIVLLKRAGSISEVTQNYRTKAITSKPLNRADFFEKALVEMRSPNLDVGDFIGRCDFTGDDTCKQALLKEFTELQTEIRANAKAAFSSWYSDDNNFTSFATLIETGNFSLLCGDLAKQKTFSALQQVLCYPVAVFNISNALDYIHDVEGVIRLFSATPHCEGAMVVSSSQIQALIDKGLGSFDAPEVHRWNDFIALLQTGEVAQHFGTLET